MKLNGKLVYLRKKKGLTQLELAETVKVSRQAVSKWESGGGMPSTENLRSLSELYGVSVDYLLNEGSEKGTESSEDNEDISEKNQKRMKNSFVKCGVVVLLLLILIGFVWFFYNNHEKNFSIRDMKGEDVTDVPKIEFHLEW